jgi:hypothetical protein
MTTSEHIKNSLKKFAPTSQKINLYNYNVGTISTRLFRITDKTGNKFKLFDFVDSIMIQTPVKVSVHFAINRPDLICSADKILKDNIYTRGLNDNLVLSCVELIKRDIQKLELGKNEAVFVFGNAVELLVDKTRQLVPEISYLQRIKSTIESKFPEIPEVIDQAKIPKDLQDLLPLLEEWAISDDSERDEKIKESSKSKLKKLFSIVNPKMELIDEYLDNFKDEPMPYEATLIMSLGELVSELALTIK